MQPNYREIFLQHQAQTTQFPLALTFSRADDVYLYDPSGKAYIDLIAGISVSSLGHSNAYVNDAIKKQVDSHMHLMVYGEFVQAPQARLAKAITDLLPPSLDCVYLVNSGAEAVEGALKLAKRVTGKSDIVACKQAYHGSTHAALSLNSEEYYKQAYRPLLPNVHFAEHNNMRSLDLINSQTACFVVEIVASEKGYVPVDCDFLQKARELCNQHCALLIVDEIQTGMGRTGSMFAFEQAGITPDVLLLGKALGAGMPIGAFVASHKLMQCLSYEPMLGHITTFGGHPVVAAAALAGIEYLKQHDILLQVPAKEALFRKLLKHPAIADVSGKGLMLALSFESFDFNKKLIDACIADGLITDWFLFAPNKLRITPPLIISQAQIEKACDIILTNLNKLLA
jgi:acetylornithine/N-succinyldiaminopimelate aminotransferase